MLTQRIRAEAKDNTEGDAESDGMPHLEQGSVKGQNKWDAGSVARMANRGRDANAMSRAFFNVRGIIVVRVQSTDVCSG